MTTRTTIITVTAKAAAKVKELLSSEPSPESMVLRLEVQPGGCAGFKYGLFFDDVISDADIIEESDGVRVAIDPMSAQHLQGLIIDWSETLTSSGFQITNPNAKSKCACGDSFQ